MKIIVFIESSNDKIHSVTLEALVAAQKGGGGVATMEANELARASQEGESKQGC